VSTSYVSRSLEPLLTRRLSERPKILLLFGAGQVGKTTLARRIIRSANWKALELSGDDLYDVQALSSRDGARLRGLVSGYELLFIDEAQRIPEIGIALKLLFDTIPELRILATGSSSLDLASRTKEALTGRAWSFTLHALSQAEILAHSGRRELDRQLDRDLVYGQYPELRSYDGDAERVAYLKELHASYLFKDVLELGGVRHPRKIVDLVRLLAYQAGSEVSFSELGNSLGMSKDTVASYIDLLEKSFIVFRLPGYSRNLCSEVTRSSKIYFWDNGVRNAAINDFRPFPERPDRGQLWENFIVAERLKRLSAAGTAAPGSYFWRLSTGAEIDYIEEAEGRLTGWEIKLSAAARARMPSSWAAAYPEAAWSRIDRLNYLGFVADEGWEEGI